MTEQVAIEQWITSTLKAADLQVPIYRHRVSGRATYPCVVWSWQDAGIDERGGGRIHQRSTLLVKVITHSESAEDASTRLLGAIEALLEGATGEIGEGAWQMTCFRLGGVTPYVEDAISPQTQPLLHEGALWSVIVGQPYN